MAEMVNYGGRMVPANTPLYLLVKMDANPDNAPADLVQGGDE